MNTELDITAALQTLDQPQNIDQHFVREVAFMVDDGYISALPAAILSNAAEVRRQLAEALEKQDLFINSTLAQLGCNILWKMFRHGMIEHHGLYLNLSTMKVNPIMV